MKPMHIIAVSTTLMAATTVAQIDIKFDEYRLPNGLTVILHEDHSAPLTAVAVMYHVGSKNERPGRTGFAHLFEHMMFKGSAHVADGEHFKLLQEVGANINGFTTEDGTTYFEVVPSNYLELALYLESDRMGFLLPAVTQMKLDNQRDVVKNERRQSYDNVPYGTADEKIAAALYPPAHPYHWPVIGSMADLSAAALEDVKNFFRTYYAPNNACLVIAGDFSDQEARPLVEKYFAEFPSGGAIERPKPAPATLARDAWLMFEDKVQLPRLYLSWHSAPDYTREDAVLTVLGRILGSGKASRLYKALVYDKQIAQSVMASESGREIAGTFDIQVTAKPGRTLDDMRQAVDSVLGEVLASGVTQAEVDAALNTIESGIVFRAATELGKAISLASFYSYTGDPGNINKQMQLYKGISPAEVQAAARKFLSAPKVILSVVPLGKTGLAATKGEETR